ncbi:MAG: Ig-like domain-containing protein [Candidatus Limnocylindrales bacterium]
MVGLIGPRGVAIAMVFAVVFGPANLVLAGVPPSPPPPPEAVDDAYAAVEDEVLDVAAPGVLANDNPGLDTCVIGTDTTGLSGSVTMNTDGSFSYTPPANFYGTTSFMYRIVNVGPCAEQVADSEATVTITVDSVNDAPTATADSFIVLKDRTLNVGVPGVLLNDHDVDGDTLNAVKVTNPAHGVVVLASDGSFSYTPAGGYTGPDAFSYKASDGSLASPTRVVSLTVTAIPPVPTPTPVPTAVPTPVPTPTAEPTAEPTLEEPTPTIEVSEDPEQSAPAEVTPAPSASAAPTPVASAEPVPAGDEGGISLPVLLVIVLFVVLVGFGAALYLPKWLAAQRGEPLDPDGPV